MPLALMAGAGIGGLACALALRRIDWDVRVFERAVPLTTEWKPSAPTTMSPRTAGPR